MSIIKSIKQVLGLGPAAENHHWDGSVPNQLSLKRGTPEAPGTELIKALNGILSFPNQGQSLAENGYVKLPGGLIVQWGTAAAGQNSATLTNFPIPFPTGFFQVTASIKSNIGTNSILNLVTTSGLSQIALAATLGPVTCSYIAIGY